MNITWIDEIFFPPMRQNVLFLTQRPLWRCNYLLNRLKQKNTLVWNCEWFISWIWWIYLCTWRVLQSERMCWWSVERAELNWWCLLASRIQCCRVLGVEPWVIPSLAPDCREMRTVNRLHPILLLFLQHPVSRWTTASSRPGAVLSSTPPLVHVKRQDK